MPRKRTAGIRGTVAKRNGGTGANSGGSRSRPTSNGATNKRKVIAKRVGPRTYKAMVVGTKTDKTKPRTTPGATNRSKPTNRKSNTAWPLSPNATVRGSSFPGGTAWTNEAWGTPPRKRYGGRLKSKWPN